MTVAYLMLYGSGWTQRWRIPAGLEEQVRAEIGQGEVKAPAASLSSIPALTPRSPWSLGGTRSPRPWSSREPRNPETT